MAPSHLGLLALLAAATSIHAAAAQTITLNPANLTRNGQLITVSWSGIPVTSSSVNPLNDPMPADTIALVQSDAPFGTRYPIKYIWVSQTAKDTYRTGSGTASFWVVNHRQDLTFLYLRYPSLAAGKGKDFAWGRQQVLASATLKVSSTLKAAPHQVRLSLRPVASSDSTASYPNTRTVHAAWQSTLSGGIAVASTKLEALQWYLPFATQGLPAPPHNSNMKLLSVVNAAFETYTPQQMCGFPANSSGWLNPGFTNFAIWSGLLPNRRYYYFVGSKSSGFSSINSFVTPPLTTADCYTGPYVGQTCDGITCDLDCLATSVDSVRMLLAADVGTNNKGDGTWSADGQGFSVLDATQSFSLRNSSGFPGPLWPGRTVSFYAASANTTIILPYATLFYALYTIGDFPAWGQQPVTYYLANSLNRESRSGRYHSAFIVGDIAYAEGMSAHWDMFLTDFEETFSAVPTMFSNGNHESADRKLPGVALPPDPESGVPDGGGECGIVYEKRLRMPVPASVTANKRPEYYSYVMGPVAVIVLSTEQVWNRSSTQYNWLVNEFEKFAKLRAQGRAPWLVVAFHRPMYVDDPDISYGLGNQWVASVLRDQLEPLFAKYQVDMTWTGHTHFYHRTCPVFKGGCRNPIQAPDGNVINAPVHLMVGNGGFQPGAAIFNTTPPWVEVESFSYGYCTLEASQTKLAVQCFDAVSGAKFDETTLTKVAGWKPNPTAADSNYASLATVPGPIGVNITSELGPTQAWLMSNLANLTDWFSKPEQAQALKLLYLILETFFDVGSAPYATINAVPGSKLFSMADVSPMYLGTSLLLNLVELALPPGLRIPAIEEIQYVLAVNSPPDPQNHLPGGRLWNMINGKVPK